MSGWTDEELVEQYRANGGSPQGNPFLSELFGRHHRRVAAWCFRMTGDREAAADLAQEVFVKAFRHLESFRGEARFSTWLYSITRNHCRNEIRSRSARPEEITDTELVHAEDPGEPLLDTLERQSSQALLQTLMRDSLDEIEAQVMTLHYAEEMPLESITRLLNLSNASGAKAYIVSARRKLQAAVARLPGWRGTGSKHESGA
jgi:RNA polymerase sigma-70 factor (ECF subfamily)